MEKWEYHTTLLSADIDNPGVKEFIEKTWPDWKPPKYVPQSLIPELNAFGEKGWELMHIEPVQSVGKNADIGFSSGGSYP